MMTFEYANKGVLVSIGTREPIWQKGFFSSVGFADRIRGSGPRLGRKSSRVMLARPASDLFLRGVARPDP